jgi:hypothetical protein
MIAFADRSACYFFHSVPKLPSVCSSTNLRFYAYPLGIGKPISLLVRTPGGRVPNSKQPKGEGEGWESILFLQRLNKVLDSRTAQQ